MQSESVDEQYMRQALDLAARGRGFVEPNPMVGCVIVKDGEAIGTGFHEKYGQPHAEPNALAACRIDPAGATVYVNLEPCSHTHKQTPPCAPRLIAAKVRRVVIGCLDPNPAVSGNGVLQLQQAGIETAVGVLEPESKQINAPYFALQQFRRPYVTLKWAQSADGFIGSIGAHRQWISNSVSRRIVHGLRARSDAILVGINTVLADDPMLTAREENLGRTLLRCVLDSGLKIPIGSRLVASARQTPLIIFCAAPAEEAQQEAKKELISAGAEVVIIPKQNGRLHLPAVLEEVGRRKATHLMVEPGPTLARSFFEMGLADRVWRIRAPAKLDRSGKPRQSARPIAAAKIPFDPVGELNLAGDRLTEHLNPTGPVYYAGVPSVDIQLVEVTE